LSAVGACQVLNIRAAINHVRDGIGLTGFEKRETVLVSAFKHSINTPNFRHGWGATPKQILSQFSGGG
jgi:hypothetical protein